MSIGENIKRLRKEKGLTQKQLGTLCQPPIDEANIRKYENDKQNPKIETIYKIADALGISASELVKLPPAPTSIIDGKRFRTGKELQKYLEYSGEKETLINIYDNFLNEKGQKKLFDYAVDLSNLEKYKKYKLPKTPNNRN